MDNEIKVSKEAQMEPSKKYTKEALLEKLTNSNFGELEKDIFNTFRAEEDKKIIEHNIRTLESLINDEVSKARVKANLEVAISRFTSLDLLTIGLSTFTILVTAYKESISSLFPSHNGLILILVFVMWIITILSLVNQVSINQGIMLNAKYLNTLIDELSDQNDKSTKK